MPAKPLASLLQSKLAPPGLAARSLRRTALLRRLESHDASAAVLLEAPAGYGKTTLLEQLFDDAREAGIGVGWLTLDAYDNASSELLHYLVRMFQDAAVLRTTPPDLSDERLQSTSPRTALGTLLSEVTTDSGRAMFFIDDLHTITSPDCLELIRLLIEHSSPALRFLFASRRRPLLEMSRYVVQERLIVLNAARIGFSTDEVALMFGAHDVPEIVTALARKTQGWPVALRLLQSACAHDPDMLHRLLVDLADVPDITDYLTEQVMSQLTPDVRDFLVATSLPACVTGDLANQLCARTDGWRRLRELERDGLFIARDASDASLYRYHSFFHDFLRGCLHQSELDIKGLHQRAAQWFLAEGRLEDALIHGVEAEQWDLVTGVLEREGNWRLGAHLGSTVLQGLQRMPDAMLQGSLGLRMTLVNLEVHFGHVESAREKFQQLRVDSEEFTVWQGASIDEPQRINCIALEALLILCEDQPLPREHLQRIRDGARKLGSRGNYVRTLVEGTVTACTYYKYGMYRECVRVAEEALPGSRRMKSDLSLMYLYVYLGLSQLALGRPILARSWHDRAFDLAADRFPHEVQRLEVMTLLAEIQYHQGDLDNARKSISTVIKELRQQSELDSTVCLAAYPIAAAVYARAGNVDAALSVLTEACSVAHYLQRDRDITILNIERVEELTRAGRYAQAQEIVSQDSFQAALGAREAEPGIPLLYMQATMAVARLALANKNAPAAAAMLEALLAEAETYENEIITLRCMTLLAAAQFAAARHARSMETLRRLNSRILPTGLKQILREEQPLIRPALEFMIEKGELSGTAAHANAQLIVASWLDLPGPVAKSEEPTAPRPTAPALSNVAGVLSPREGEVLELLAAGLSGKEIATRLSLSEGTIKAYRKALYAKLRAGRRSQALANARRMMLLSQ